MKRVLVSAPYMLPFPDRFRGRLEAEGITIITAPVKERLSEAELKPLVSDIDGAICGDDAYTRQVLSEAPRLKIISKWGTGIDSIDLAAAAEFGIQVCNTPNAFTDAVADTTLGYILCFARKIPWMDRAIRNGFWEKPQGISLRECTLGIIGVGSIGKAVARRASSFGMGILGTDTVALSGEFLHETGMKMTDLEELVSHSDFISVHCDLNPSSLQLLGNGEFALMRDSAVLINTARGPIVNQASLIRALNEGKISGAALDVFEVEPLPDDNELRNMPNVLLAPHNSNTSPAARERVHVSTIENLLNGLSEVF